MLVRRIFLLVLFNLSDYGQVCTTVFALNFVKFVLKSVQFEVLVHILLECVCFLLMLIDLLFELYNLVFVVLYFVLLQSLNVGLSILNALVDLSNLARNLYVDVLALLHCHGLCKVSDIKENLLCPCR